MEKKQKLIRQIIDLLLENDISLEDVAVEMAKLPMPFDLLYRIGLDIRRIPFSERKNVPPESIWAIFPFSTNVYLEFDEYVPSRRGYHEDIPSVEYFERLFEIKDKLNACLAELGKPLLEGNYYATRGKANWIVEFHQGRDCLKAACYEDTKLAKLRFCGNFEK